MNRQAQAVVLLLVGGAVLRAGLTDLYLRYVRHGLRPLLVAAGALLVATAAATLWAELRRSIEPEPAPRVAWLLVFPVLGLLLVPPPALGSYSAARAGTAAAQASSGFVPLPPGDPVPLTVLDYVSRAVYDQGRSMAGRRVRISGFLTPASHGGWFLTRMILTCCAADARPIKVALTGRLPGGLTSDGWLVVTGRYIDKIDKDPVNGEQIPSIEVEHAAAVGAPADGYER